MDLGRGKTSEAPDDNVPFEIVPLEHGPRADAQALANSNRNRDLSLTGDLGVGEGHVYAHYLGNGLGQFADFPDVPVGCILSLLSPLQARCPQRA